MLMLTVKKGEKIILNLTNGDKIELVFKIRLRPQDSHVMIGIDANKDVSVKRVKDDK